MPLYEYVCRKCSHPFEELVFGDEAPRCPSCDAVNVEKVLSAHTVGRAAGSKAAFGGGGGPCGSCGDPRGPGACSMN
jgi:putative FmdB family regulatory protein